jgi:hypothetical protein
MCNSLLLLVIQSSEWKYDAVFLIEIQKIRSSSTKNQQPRQLTDQQEAKNMSHQQHQQQQRKRKRVSHRGICNGCGGNLTSSNAFSKHIYKKCFNTIPLISTGIPGGDFSSASILEEAGREEGYIVNITCENDPKSFWIYAGVPKSFTLGQFLKVVWCDCGCGHLSSFSVQTTQGWKKDAEKFETNIGTKLIVCED